MAPHATQTLTGSANMSTNPSRDLSLSDLMRELQSQRDLLSTLLRMQNTLSDQIDDLITKVDEINLPTGSGFTTDYES